jgi:hypothetical protein
MIVLAHPTKLCSKCLVDKPIEEFRLRQEKHANGRRRTECIACLNRYATDRVRLKRFKRLGGDISQLARPGQSAEVLAWFIESTMRRFGGREAFMELLADEIRAERERRGGSRLLLKLGSAVIQLALAEAASRPKPPDMEELSDNDLKRELRRLSSQPTSTTLDECLAAPS